MSVLLWTNLESTNYESILAVVQVILLMIYNTWTWGYSLLPSGESKLRSLSVFWMISGWTTWNARPLV
jgi:hypothetical protein